MNWPMPGSSWQDFDLSAVPSTNATNSPVITPGMMGESKRRRLNVTDECKRRRRCSEPVKLSLQSQRLVWWVNLNDVV